MYAKIRAGRIFKKCFPWHHNAIERYFRLHISVPYFLCNPYLPQNSSRFVAIFLHSSLKTWSLKKNSLQNYKGHKSSNNSNVPYLLANRQGNSTSFSLCVHRTLYEKKKFLLLIYSRVLLSIVAE